MHLPGKDGRVPRREMHLLVQEAHLPIARDRGRHRATHLLRMRRLENISEARFSDGAPPFARSLVRFSTEDAHLPSSKMHPRAKPVAATHPATPLSTKGRGHNSHGWGLSDERPREAIEARSLPAREVRASAREHQLPPRAA